ncbi:MAG: CheR family methyltransferase [bacterium]
MDRELQLILKYLHAECGFDFSGYRSPTVDRRVKQRLAATRSSSFSEYLRYLEKSRDELDHLLSTLTIKVSRFFRDTLTFEYIANEILPTLISEKIRNDNHSLRVWSAGCATGEEAYSMAILIHGLKEKDVPPLNLHINIIFAKLYRSLAESGYLILGKAESPIIKYQKCFRKINGYGQVYQKRG